MLFFFFRISARIPNIDAEAIYSFFLKFSKQIREDHSFYFNQQCVIYEGHLESKERFAIQRYLLIIGKKKNMQVL